MRSALECQATSGETRTRCELGEEWTTETALPLGHDQQKLPSRFQRRKPLTTTRLEGIDTALDSMASRVGIVLQDHLARFVEREHETSKPANETPRQTRRNHRLVIRIFVSLFVRLLHGIADLLTAVLQDGAIGRARGIPLRRFPCWIFLLLILRHIQILLGQREQPRCGEAFIGKNERRDSR